MNSKKIDRRNRALKLVRNRIEFWEDLADSSDQTVIVDGVECNPAAKLAQASYEEQRLIAKGAFNRES